jgi:hypothetical protein
LGFRCVIDPTANSEKTQSRQIRPTATFPYTAEPPESKNAGDSDPIAEYGSVLAFINSGRLMEGENEPGFAGVPACNLPILDGTISSGEWDGAEFDTFDDGSEIRLMQAAIFFNLGLRAKASGTIAGKVFNQQGDQIRILHSSTVLGTAISQKGDQLCYKV